MFCTFYDSIPDDNERDMVPYYNFAVYVVYSVISLNSHVWNTFQQKYETGGEVNLILSLYLQRQGTLVNGSLTGMWEITWIVRKKADRGKF